MKVTTTLILAAAQLVHAHGGHEHGPDKGESMKAYVQRHMATEHHIDKFDLKSFFALHDLDRDGVWTRAEIEAVYGVHHIFSQKMSPDDKAHKAKADKIVDAVLERIDTNHDGLISMEEFEKAGLDALPDFKELGAEGHHYSEESEFFLHHEEQFHSTPETQTDEAYNHPEDLEHFARHEAIEREEENKERAYQGLPPLKPDEPTRAELLEKARQEAEKNGGTAGDPNLEAAKKGAGQKPPKPKYTRRPKDDPRKIYREAMHEGKDKAEWGQGPDGYKRPKSQGDRGRKNLPYKYKFRRTWGDF
jgi:hypothetical protein